MSGQVPASLQTMYDFIAAVFNAIFLSDYKLFGVITLGTLVFGGAVFIAVVRFVAGIGKGTPSMWNISNDVRRFNRSNN